MQATIPSGSKFAADGQCTAGTLHAMVDNATFASLGLADFLSTERPIHNSGTATVNPVTGQLWFLPNYSGDSTNPAGVLCIYDGASFVPIADGFYGKCAGAASAGEAVVVQMPDSTSLWINGFAAENPAAGDTSIVGVSAQALAYAESGLIISRGFAYCSNVPANAIVLGAMSSAGAGVMAADSTAVTTGCFARVLDVTKKLIFITGMLKVT